MQKSIIIVLSITLMLSLCACGNNHTGTPSTSPALSIADVENGSTSIKEVSGDTESEPSEDEHEVTFYVGQLIFSCQILLLRKLKIRKRKL